MIYVNSASVKSVVTYIYICFVENDLKLSSPFLAFVISLCFVNSFYQHYFRGKRT